MIWEEEVRQDTILDVARMMLVAARTAPKARGRDNLVLAVALPSDIPHIAEKMRSIGNRMEPGNLFHRDAENILVAGAIVMMGTRIRVQEVKICGRCGFANCSEKEKHPGVPCSFNTGDLGIAMGSAVSVAMNHRIDCRIMYTVGQALIELKTLGNGVAVAFGIPLSVSAKNPFFDRTS